MHEPAKAFAGAAEPRGTTHRVGRWASPAVRSAGTSTSGSARTSWTEGRGQRPHGTASAAVPAWRRSRSRNGCGARAGRLPAQLSPGSS